MIFYKSNKYLNEHKTKMDPHKYSQHPWYVKRLFGHRVANHSFIFTFFLPIKSYLLTVKIAKVLKL